MCASQSQFELQQAVLHVHKVLAGEGTGTTTHQRVGLPRCAHYETETKSLSNTLKTCYLTLLCTPCTSSVSVSTVYVVLLHKAICWVCIDAQIILKPLKSSNLQTQ